MSNSFNTQTLKQFKNKTLLFIDDDEKLLIESKKLFSNFFKSVLISTNGKEGFEVYKENHIDLIITDISMPKLNGLDMVELIRKENKDIPIILSTAYDDKPLLKRALNLNITAYIEKPLNLNELLTVLKKVAEIFDSNLSEYIFISNCIKIHKDTLEAYMNENRINLSPQEKIILYNLAINIPNPITYETLEYELNSTEFLSKEAIRVAVSSLRKKVPQINIKNVPKVGYCICE